VRISQMHKEYCFA